VREDSTSPHFDLPRLRQHPALLATPSTPDAQMDTNNNKKSLRETLRMRDVPRIVEATEKRLRAVYQGSWMMSARAWKKFMDGDTPPAKE
jgi:hypothetical protein